MKTSRWIFFVAALLLAGAAPASAAWSPLGSPIQPFLTLQLDPGRPELLYARVFASEGPEEDYLWRSEDGGVTWRNVQSGLENPVNAFAIDPSNPRVIWVWTPDGQLWRSGDAGDSWTRRLTTPTDQIPPDVLQLLVDPHHPDTLYRVDAENGLTTIVAVSRDGGASFTKGTSVSSRPFSIATVYVHPERDELVAFDHDGLKASADGGRTWSLRGRYRGAGLRNGRPAPSDPDTLYGLTNDSNRCLTRSDDAGAHWQDLAFPPRRPAGSYCSDVAIDPRDAHHVWLAVVEFPVAGRRNLLFESRDGGRTWSRPVSAPTDGVVAAGGGALYTGSIRGFGLFVSQDGGHTWKRSDQGIIAGDLRGGLVAQRLPGGGVGRRLLALYTPIGGSPDGIYRSDGGKDWVKTPLEEPSQVVDTGGSTVLAVDQRDIVRSQDGGTTWAVAATAPRQSFALLSSVTRPRYVALLAFEDNGAYGKVPLWTSDDGGATWRRSSNGLPIVCTHIASVDVCPDFTGYTVDPFNPSRRWVFGIDTYPEQPRVFISENDGASWQVASLLPGPLALAADPHIPGRLLAGTYNGLFVSEDAGAHWLPLGDLPAGAAVRQLARDERSATWYAATTARGIYRSLDNGAHWTLLEGAPDHDSPAIAVDPRRPTALLATFRGQGVWRWTL